MSALFIKFPRCLAFCPSSVRFCVSYSVVRVRFAPSPTGSLHLGGLRTAFYNYLFARANKGIFILRIEDTDRSRFVPGATEKIIDDLKWAGLEIDEGPSGLGKDDPYYQSNRIELYRTEVKKLLESGKAYYCFCTEKRLDILRKEAIRTRQVPKYDNRCRNSTPLESASKLANNSPFCIRFKLSEHSDPFDDMVYGPVVHNVAENEGDPVIIKSDGYPTYHFASVVDDHHMEITHVLRGVEWQISTTKHILLYKAFGWHPPKFGHLPLLVNSDGTKLSKRQGDIQISHYKDRGIYPIALLNYITQAGGGFNKPSLRPHLHTIDQLVEMFDLSKINVNPSKLNKDSLSEFNQLELQRHIADRDKCRALANDLHKLVEQKYYRQKQNLDLNLDHTQTILKWAQIRVSSIHELTEDKFSFLWILPSDRVTADYEEEVMIELIAKLYISSFNKENIKNILKNFCEEKSLKFPALMGTLRAALSGLNEGPGVAEMMEILGKHATLKRIGKIKCK